MVRNTEAVQTIRRGKVGGPGIKFIQAICSLIKKHVFMELYVHTSMYGHGTKRDVTWSVPFKCTWECVPLLCRIISRHTSQLAWRQFSFFFFFSDILETTRVLTVALEIRFLSQFTFLPQVRPIFRRILSLSLCATFARNCSTLIAVVAFENDKRLALKTIIRSPIKSLCPGSLIWHTLQVLRASISHGTLNEWTYHDMLRRIVVSRYQW